MMSEKFNENAFKQQMIKLNSFAKIELIYLACI